MKRPYVGVSGVVSPEQEKQITEIYERSGLEQLGRTVLLGVKATKKTLMDGIENKYGRGWYPVCNDLPDVLKPCNLRSSDCETRRTTPVIQAYMGEIRPKNINYQYVAGFCMRAIEMCGPWHPYGIQFDRFPWHEAGTEYVFSVVKAMKDLVDDDVDLSSQKHYKVWKERSVIVQCYGEMMQEYSPQKIAKRLGKLANQQLVDYVLFDSSGGKGVSLEIEAVKPYIDAIYSEAGDKLNLVVAGGLCSQTVSKMQYLLKNYPSISWDAEYELHQNGNSDRSLDMSETEEYLLASADVIRSAA